MKKANPPMSLVNQVLDKIRNSSKNKIDLKNTTGFQLFKKNLTTNSLARKVDNSEKNVKISQDFETCKSLSKLKTFKKQNEVQYASEKSNKNTSSSSLYKVNISTKDNTSLSRYKVKKPSLPINNILSTRSSLVKPNLLSNMSTNNINELLPISPSDNILSPNVAQSSNFSKFKDITHSKHKKGSKSVSYQFNISSINMMKINQESAQVNFPTNHNYFSDEEEAQKPSKSRCKDKKLTHGGIDILGLLSGNTKSVGKLSTEGSTMSSIVMSAKAKVSEVESPEELHYLYVKMVKESRNLPYPVPVHKGYH